MRCGETRREVALKLADILIRVMGGEEVGDCEINRLVEKMTPEEMDEFARMVIKAIEEAEVAQYSR